ncbi:MAG: enoyl-CoA hydratase/isomerase family protein [Pseudorhodoplanes sp.]|nr:enoyl-CoA hydratase/isomerase family protein [Pseudorhodoplanes sp.]
MRHGKANALDVEFCQALTGCFQGLKDGPPQGVVLTGEGSIFSAGVDLLRALDEGPDYFRIFLPALHALYETLFFFPKPVVAAINGHAIAGGCVLACCADRRVMVRGQGRIGVTELLVGLPFPHLAFEIMRFVTASHRFEEVMVGAATYPPQDGYERGLVNLLVEPGTLAEQAQMDAEKLVAISPPAFGLTKRQSRKPVADAFARDGRKLEDAVTEIWTQPESLARVKSYVARTLRKG